MRWLYGEPLEVGVVASGPCGWLVLRRRGSAARPAGAVWAGASDPTVSRLITALAGDVEAVVPTIRAARAWAHRDAAVHDGRCPASRGVSLWFSSSR